MTAHTDIVLVEFGTDEFRKLLDKAKQRKAEQQETETPEVEE